MHFAKFLKVLKALTNIAVLLESDYTLQILALTNLKSTHISAHQLNVKKKLFLRHRQSKKEITQTYTTKHKNIYFRHFHISFTYTIPIIYGQTK